MPVPGAPRPFPDPATLPALNLPPRFVTDHCIRTLFYHGPRSPLDLANHWRVHPDIAIEIVESLKSAGLVAADAGQTTFERHTRVHLTEEGQAQIAPARERTWYSGALPVAVADLAARLNARAPTAAPRDVVRATLAPFFLDERCADEIGQALCAHSAVAIVGAAADEQPGLASALGSSLQGEVSLPYAVFAAGAVIRWYDPRHHRLPRRDMRADDGADVLRAREESISQWMSVRPPVVTLAGGVLASDVTPAYDEDARFYLAPMPLVACGGLLAIFEADQEPAHLADLARLWLVPGRHGVGITLLRSGERIELPWYASTLLFASSVDRLREGSGDVLSGVIDISTLCGEHLRALLIARLEGLPSMPSETIDQLATLLEAAGGSTRAAAAAAAAYVAGRASYEGDAFTPSQRTIEQAAAVASPSAPRHKAKVRPVPRQAA